MHSGKRLLAVIALLAALSVAVQARSRQALADDGILANGGFETGDLSGWQVVGDTAVVQETLDPLTESCLHTIVEGKFAVKIGDEVPWAQRGPQSSSISQQFTVPSPVAGQTKVVLQFAYAVVANDPPDHAEPDKPLFRVTVQDLSSGQNLFDTSYVFTSQTSGKWFLGLDPNPSVSQRGLNIFRGDRWVFQPWQNVEVDLSRLSGHRIEVQFLVRDCNPTAHAAYGYLDSIGVGTPRKVSLPKLEGSPKPAPYIKTNLIYQLFGLMERLRLWPWLLCLVPLLLLLLLLLLLRRRQPQVRRSGFSGTSPPSQKKPPAPPPVGGATVSKR